MNSVILMGRILKDIELKKTVNGVSIINFGIAVARPYQKDKEQESDFIDCVAWRAVAEFIERNFGKGDPILVTGEIRTDNYEDKNGEKRKGVTVHVSNAEFVLGNKKKKEKTETKAEELQTTYTEDFTEVSGDDDLPF
ncbi:MAG: single-stranded DNA-binding protein [Clostridiales bacterium]|nr:single-stranded DNA-binding protein [Clostridiales bacterium]